jgi:hypothetical protein
MARFHGNVGYGISVQTTPGVFSPSIIEREYFGETIEESRQLQQGDQVNPNLTINNRISIVADDFATEHLQAIRYVILYGAYWRVTGCKIQRPRIILSVGGPYNGPKATA